MSEVQLCPQARLHTPCPEGYIQWHAWAEEMSKTHKQIKCKGCGRYSIWVPKGNAMTDKDAMIEAVARAIYEAAGHSRWDETSWKPIWRRYARGALTAIEPFMQAREQAAREEGRDAEWNDVIEYLDNDIRAWLDMGPSDRREWQALTELAGAITRNEHREQQDG